MASEEFHRIAQTIAFETANFAIEHLDSLKPVAKEMNSQVSVRKLRALLRAQIEDIIVSTLTEPQEP